MLKKLPSIVITGASGFVGRYLVDSVKDEYNVYAIARRSRNEAGIPFHRNIQWIQADISNPESLNEVINYIVEHGGADFVVHLAAFYDFTYKDHPEYQRTNINGTEYILRFAEAIEAKRFLFASSLAACEFPKQGEVINEKSLPDAKYAYAISKRIGEGIVAKHSKTISCSILRFAAIYSDWCEFAPLYKFLSSWLSKKVDSRIIAGKGESAIPYIHIHDLIALIKVIFKKHDELPRFNIFNVCHNGSTSHKEIFEIATRYFFCEPVKPIHLPKILAYPGLVVRKLLKIFNLTCDEPFEKFWMIKYIDQKLNVDSSHTRFVLNWEPTPRYHIKRRLLFLLEKLKTHPDEWCLKNEAALKRVALRANLLIYQNMTKYKESNLDLIKQIMLTNDEKGLFARYKKMDEKDYQCYMSTLYHLLMATVRSGDRKLILQYIEDIALRRFAEGFIPQELCETLSVFKDVIISRLLSISELHPIKQEVYDSIGLSLQLAQDQIEDIYENLLKKISIEKIADSPLLPDCKELQKMIRQLSAFYQISPDNGKYYNELH